MIKKIIAISDLHIRNLKRIDEISDILQKFIDECKTISAEFQKNEVRIVIAGDIFHSKIEISNEAQLLCGWFLRELSQIAEIIIFAGNHDLLKNNLSRVDSLTTIISLSKLDNCTYLDSVFDYQSNCYVDDNIVWSLYSIFDDYNKPDFVDLKLKFKDKTFIGLIHGDINGAKSDTGYLTENGLEPDYFSDVDFVIAGHIHKHQMLKKNGVKIVYCGSPYQQDFGESITQHGYVIWDVEKQDFEYRLLENNDYGFYGFNIKSIEDIDNDDEELLNL